VLRLSWVKPEPLPTRKRLVSFEGDELFLLVYNAFFKIKGEGIG
jgi:hypothetical protein